MIGLDVKDAEMFFDALCDLNLECPKRSFRLRLGRRFLEKINVFFTTKNLQLVYPPLWQGPFNENPYAKLRLGRSKASTHSANLAAKDLRSLSNRLPVIVALSGAREAAPQLLVLVLSW